MYNTVADGGILLLVVLRGDGHIGNNTYQYQRGHYRKHYGQLDTSFIKNIIEVQYQHPMEIVVLDIHDLHPRQKPPGKNNQRTESQQYKDEKGNRGDQVKIWRLFFSYDIQVAPIGLIDQVIVG